MAEPRTIYCPLCKRKVMAYDGRTKMNLQAKCKKCKKLVVFYAETGETILKKVPERDQASGMRFY